MRCIRFFAWSLTFVQLTARHLLLASRTLLGWLFAHKSLAILLFAAVLMLSFRPHWHPYPSHLCYAKAFKVPASRMLNAVA